MEGFFKVSFSPQVLVNCLQDIPLVCFKHAVIFRIQPSVLAKVILAEAKRVSTLFIHIKVFMQQ